MLLATRGLRGFCDGFVAVLLPAYLLALGLGVWEVGLLSTVTLAGSAAATLAVGAVGHRVRTRRLLRGAALLMMATGLGFAAFGTVASPAWWPSWMPFLSPFSSPFSSPFWPLAVVAFFGTLNPSAGDVSLFLPIEHAQLAQAAHTHHARTALFARYSLTGSLCAAVGALASGLPALAVAHAGWPLLTALRSMFVLYAAVGGVVWLLYRRLPAAPPETSAAPAPLDASRAVVVKLAALFCVDSFAGGLLVNALLALWLFQRFGVSLAQAGQFFFWAGLLTTSSQLLAPVLARRIGLLNTMVFTHIPASLCLIGAALSPSLPLALALLLARAACASMDVPARSAYVMAVVTPAERAAAASFTAVPRSLASALGPSIGGALLASGFLAAPLVLCGGLKIAYDLALLYTFRDLRIE